MRPRPIFVTLSLVLAFSSTTTPLDAETFTTSLTTGSKGVEVVALQQVLVSEGYLIMPAGVAYGYFGPLTRTAVAKWQSANGVSPAVGYWGPISRAVFASKSRAPMDNVIPITNISPSVPPVSSGIAYVDDTPRALGMRASRIMLFRASPFEVRAGDTITLDGSGFSKTSNKIYFDGTHATTGVSTNGAVMETTVPENISNGEYELSVENVLGSSANPDIKIKIRVTNNPQPPPIITNASISGDIVTVVGTGFTSSNSLFTTLGESSRSISSNGTTFTFRITDLSRYEQIKKFTQSKYQTAFWIYVQNEHGMNKDPYQLNIII